MGRHPISFFFLFLFFFVVACKQKENRPPESENDLDAARNFIRAALDGKFEDARGYMLQDSVNNNYLDVVERAYQRMDTATKEGYRGSSIRFYPTISVNDSTIVVVYANSFKNDPDTLKVLRIKGLWLVDLKYLYEHDLDTSLNKMITRDTTRK